MIVPSKHWLLAAAAYLGLSPWLVQAQQPTSGSLPTQRGQPDPSKLAGICTSIFHNLQDASSPNNYTYAYERQIYEAAGVDFEADTQADARDKIQRLWIEQRHQLRCTGVNFRVPNGSILKYAIENRAWSILDNASRFWGVDLNLVDEADGATVLDYLSDRIEDNFGSPIAITLSNYHDRLRRYGARHCDELPDTSLCRPREILCDQSGKAQGYQDSPWYTGRARRCLLPRVDR